MPLQPFKRDLSQVSEPSITDVDSGITAIHHTLGHEAFQASPGSHRHDGSDSHNIELKNLVGQTVSFHPQGGTLGTQPTFNGDPLIVGTYTRWGNMCYFNIMIDMGNITSFGTGQYYLTLPFKPARMVQFADGCLHDISSGTDYPIFAHTVEDSTRIVLKSIDSHANSAYNVPFAQGTPITLSTADNFHIAGTYEIMQ